MLGSVSTDKCNSPDHYVSAYTKYLPLVEHYTACEHAQSKSNYG